MYESDTPMAASDLMLQTCCWEGIIFAVIVKACKPHKEQVVKVKNVLNRAESKDEALIEHRRSMISSVRNVAESNGQGQIRDQNSHLHLIHCLAMNLALLVDIIF
ncbi:hypothetical protein BY996DRAFT_6420832 [Phakopsora pachyrhizi]|nr:hypothetical protein BY996DRAFT_6420832 [Phakopsora pachyrhizi]